MSDERCGSECGGYRCDLPKGHTGEHIQDEGSPLGAHWPSDDPFDRCECSGKGRCHVCRAKTALATVKARVEELEGLARALCEDVREAISDEADPNVWRTLLALEDSLSKKGMHRE